MTFKEKIVKLRKQKGLTQDDFASAVGVSRQAVYKWESGQSYPEAQKLLEIKKLFDISIDDLLDDSYDVVVPEKKKRKRLSKDVKEAVIAEVKEESAPEEAPVEAAPVVEEPSAPAEEPAAVETREEPAADEPREEPAAEAFEEAPAVSEEEEPKKKVGFFGRIFGKK
jgi:transcriptional regulator with XRE-family HTH domain